MHRQVRYHEPLAALSCRDVPAGPAMKEFYICDCARLENQTITSLFVVAAKQVKSKKNGELYLSVTLADRSGQLQANMWDNVADTLDSFQQDDFVKVKGVVHKYNGRWQLTIHKLRKLEDPEIDYSDYLPKTSKDIDGLWRTLSEFVESFENRWLKSLLQEFMADEAIVAAYKNAPAAKTLHHAFVGGLLDHVVSLFTVCDLAARNYPQVNRDLLLTGAFLNDDGKLHQKLAHLPGFPAELKILIEHMIISHHGHYEFGSPKLPMFPEALMLHYLDDLDSKMESMRAQFEREADYDSPWTSYNPSLARPLLNTKKFLEKGLSASREAEARKSAAVAGNGNTSPEPAVVQNVEAQPESAAAQPAEKEPEPSPLEALERKFASHKVTPVAGTGKSSSS